MNHSQHNQIVNFIWSIADDVLRGIYSRGKYRDIILPFTVLSWALSNQAALASLSVRKLSQLRDISVVWPFVPDV
jgi:type I restriction-modification system DNA methylase subunit